MLQFTGCAAVKQFAALDAAQTLRGITRGFEKECLRVNPDGTLSQRPHPPSLGSKLTHPWITTDYSEALLEFITPPSQDPGFALPFLRDLHRYTAQQIGDELLWTGSMPGVLGDDSEIPLANYGNSNTARIKWVYRQGLGLRYGRQMQTIAGVHFNWSLPVAFWEQFYAFCKGSGSLQDFVSDRYFGLVRNFLRFSWLIPYLFGASPAVSTSFLRGRKPLLTALGNNTLYGPHATCLRMSDLGYQNRAQSQLSVSYNSLTDYAGALDAAIHTPDPFYAAIGVRDGSEPDAPWKQLNANVLQIENEFYAGIRPKRVGLKGERPAVALKRYGVEYLEVRLFDLNPMIDIGIAPEQATFCDAFLLMCLLRDSPPISPREQGENDENKRRVVNRGRDPSLYLLVHNQEQPFRPLAHALFDDMQPFAALLDIAYGGNQHSATLAQLRQRIDAPETTPSAQVLEGVLHVGSLADHTAEWSRKHKSSLLAQSLATDVMQQLSDAAMRSLQAQAAIEASPQIPFEEYVANYFA
jgi:glutamate--cysteine ligase